MPIVLPAKGLAKPFYKSADGAGGQYNTESLLTLYDILLSFFPTEDTEKKRPQRIQRKLCDLCVFSVISVGKKSPRRTQRFFCGLRENTFNRDLV
jgi:hypothetical protein